MIKSLNDWKKYNNKIINENNNLINDTFDDDIDYIEDDVQLKIKEIVDYAKSLELNKEQTLDIISTFFVDPAQAPENISVSFVQNYQNEILQYIHNIPESEFSNVEYNYTKDMTTNDFSFECAMYIPNNENIKELTNILNEKINKPKFKAIYENNIFFINSLELLNENNKNIVLNTLKNNNAKNITNILKWQRKIK